MSKYNKEYYEAHKPEIKEKMRVYHAENREHFRIKHNEYYQENIEKIRTRRRKYRAKPDVQMRIWCQNSISRHIRRGHDVTISIETLINYANTAKTCYLCGTPLDWTPNREKANQTSPTLDRVNNGKQIDHVWNGRDDNARGAVAIACMRCNATKNDRTYKEFLNFCKQITEAHT
jgi:hypothetical protein